MTRFIIEVDDEEKAWLVYGLLLCLRDGKKITAEYSENLDHVVQLEKGIVTKLTEHKFEFNPHEKVNDARLDEQEWLMSDHYNNL